MDNLKADVVTGTTTISNLKSLESTIDYIEGDNIYYTNSTLTNIKVLESTVELYRGR